MFYLPERDLLSLAHSLEAHLKVAAQMPFSGSRNSGETDLSGASSVDGANAVGEVADTMGIRKVLQQRCFQISDGERRRAELAVALLRGPACLLADQPFASIAPADRAVVANALRELAGQGCAVIVTGHDVTDVLALADSVTWMAVGTTHQLGTPEGARSHDQFVRGYLGSR